MMVVRLLRSPAVARCCGFVLCLFVATLSGCGGDDDEPSSSSSPDDSSAPEIKGTPFHVAGPGSEWVFVQGKVTGPDSDDENLIVVELYDVPFDRCHVPESESLLGPPDIRLTLEPRLGEQPLGIGNLDTSLPVPFADGQVSIDAIGPTGLSGKLALRDFNDVVWSGAFNADGCGWLGQDLFNVGECDASVFSSINPFGNFALSGDGRLASFAAPNFYEDVEFLRVIGSASACSVVRDSNYGVDGKITFPASVSAVAFDQRGRAYVTTSSDYDGAGGSLYRLSPGGAMEACRYFDVWEEGQTIGGGPSALFVLPDGSAAFLYWDGVGEWRLDLGDAPLGANDEPCRFVPRYDDLRGYTGALAAADEGLLFTRDIGGRIRAVVTDWELTDTLRFGGTPSGLGLQGLTEQNGATRCPHGWGFVKGGELRVFGLDGAFRGLVRLDSTPEIGVTPVLVGGSPSSIDVFGTAAPFEEQTMWRVVRLTAR